jgi:hypothetical protein
MWWTVTAFAGICDDLAVLRGDAVYGRLSAEAVACLEQKYESEEDLEQVSRLLLEDLWAKREFARWELLAARHLEEIDSEDPNLILRYVTHLAGQEPRKDEEILRWAPVGLDHQEEWLTSPLMGSRVGILLQEIVYSSVALWKEATATARRVPSPEHEAAAEAARRQVVLATRDWLVHARKTGLHTATMAQTCKAAGGTPEECAP